MVVPFIAMLAVFLIIVVVLVLGAKKKNRQKLGERK
jgi:hypothetical protein